MKILAVLFAIILLSGCIIPFGKIHRKGFSQEDLTVPNIYPYTSQKQEKPAATMRSQPGYSYNISWEMGKAYISYGGVAKIFVNNTGNNDIFIYNFGIKIGSQEWRWGNNDTGVFVPTGEKKKFYLSFGSPLTPGKYSYELKISFMIDNKAGVFPFHKRNEWYDNGTSVVKTKKPLSIDIRPYNSSSNYKYLKNYYYYFDKINGMVKPFDPLIMQKANEITSSYPGSYNVFQLCAVFDYLREKMEYIPEEEDVWSTPSETLMDGGGDCEDFAMLFSALVTAKGGTARIYMTDNHAFASIYIGNENDANDILKNIEEYYGTNLFFATFKDKFGYWLVADPLGSFYLGGLPVGSDVIGPLQGEKLYNWGFVGTSKVYIVDVMKE